MHRRRPRSWTPASSPWRPTCSRPACDSISDMTFVTRGLRDRPMPTIHGALMRTAATAVLAGALVGTLAGCEHDELATRPRTPVNGTLFASYVAMGNSITAGYQSGGIVD